MFNDYSRILGANIDMRLVTIDDLNEYRMHGYRPHWPLGVRHIQPNAQNVVPPVANNNNNNNNVVRHQLTLADMFNRGVKKSKDNYIEG